VVTTGGAEVEVAGGGIVAVDKEAGSKTRGISGHILLRSTRHSLVTNEGGSESGNRDDDGGTQRRTHPGGDIKCDTSDADTRSFNLAPPPNAGGLLDLRASRREEGRSNSRRLSLVFR
jgi:hypothetical protein